jgi:hypothetical protein
MAKVVDESDDSWTSGLSGNVTFNVTDCRQILSRQTNSPEHFCDSEHVINPQLSPLHSVLLKKVPGSSAHPVHCDNTIADNTHAITDLSKYRFILPSS